MPQTEQWMDVHLLFKQFGSIRAVAKQTGYSRNIVYQMLRSEAPPSFNKATRKSGIGIDDVADYLNRLCLPLS